MRIPGFRYLFQFVAMLCDIITVGVAAALIYVAPTNPIAWALATLLFRKWYAQGGFMAWKPTNIRSFLRNAKRAGM